MDRTPRAWEVTVGGIRVCVHRHKDFPPDVWLLSAAFVMANNHTLASKELAEALDEALAYVRHWCMAVMEDCSNIKR